MMTEVGIGEYPPLAAVESADRDRVLEAAYGAHYSQLVGLARLLLDDRGQAEEVVQEAFVRTYSGWDRVRNQHDPVPYLRRSVVNLSRGGLRRRRTVRERRLEPVPDTEGADVAVERDDTSHRLSEAVRRLPERQRACVVLRYFMECSTAECADALGISEGSVKTHLHRALAALAPRLEELR
jgi:RNA polymerase sigma-70 factor (sigma-E family)